MALAKPLNVSGEFISPTQEGFIRGRQMVRNILLVEGVVKHCPKKELEAVMAFLDMAAACPSISRESLFRILASFGAPPWWLRAVEQLYRCSERYIVWQ